MKQYTGLGRQVAGSITQHPRSRSHITTTQTKPPIPSHVPAAPYVTGATLYWFIYFRSSRTKRFPYIRYTGFYDPVYTDRCGKDTGTRRGQRNTTYVHITYSHRTRTNPLCRRGERAQHRVAPF